MGFRVIIKLTKYFTDERAFSYIFVNDNFKLINDLETYLADIFNLEGHFCLMKDNCLLPSIENINVILADETITVTPLREQFNFIENIQKPGDEIVENPEKDSKKKKRKKNKETSQDQTPLELECDDKITISEVVSNHSSPEITNKKYKILENKEVYDAIKNIEEFHSQLVEKNENEELEATKTKALNALKNYFPTNINGVSDGRIKKRKRIRIRKSKKSNQIDLIHSDSESNKSTSYVLTNGNGKKSSHIRFSSENSINVLQNDATHSNFDKTPRIIRGIQANMISELKSNNSLANGNDILKTSGAEKIQNIEVASNDLHAKVSVGKLETKTNGDNVLNTKDMNLAKLLINLDLYPVQNSISLKENNVLLFKLLKLDESYTPTVSDYILGKVVDSDTDSQMAKITILDGHQQCSEPTGKFNLEEEHESKAVESIDIGWDQLRDVRLIITK